MKMLMFIEGVQMISAKGIAINCDSVLHVIRRRLRQCRM